VELRQGGTLPRRRKERKVRAVYSEKRGGLGKSPKEDRWCGKRKYLTLIERGGMDQEGGVLKGKDTKQICTKGEGKFSSILK